MGGHGRRIWPGIERRGSDRVIARLVGRTIEKTLLVEHVINLAMNNDRVIQRDGCIQTLLELASPVPNNKKSYVSVI